MGGYHTFEVLSTLTTRSGGAAVRLRRESDKLAVEVGSRPNLHVTHAMSILKHV